MNIEKTFEKRLSLTDNELERLHFALVDEARRYRWGIENYPSERMAQHGKPFLLRLENRVREVEDLMRDRGLL